MTYAQDKKELPIKPKNNIENFSEQSGAMLKKEFFKIANIKGSNFEVV